MVDLLEKEWFIEAPWGRICVVAWGNSINPPVLLCHGAVDSAASFRPLLRLLPREFYYVAFELPGNGKSTPFPPGLMINVYDMVYAMKVVVDHFRWKDYTFMGHSLGTLIGKLYNSTYPGRMTKVIDLDPTSTFSSVEPDEFAQWYHTYFTNFFNKYDKLNASKDQAPTYTKEEAMDLFKRNRGLSDETAAATIERLSEPINDRLIRFTFDQRTKLITPPPFSAKHKQEILTAISTPTLAILTEQVLKLGLYERVTCALDESAYPANNYRVRKVVGHHDVHVTNPERLASYVETFLLGGLEGLDRKSKL